MDLSTQLLNSTIKGTDWHSIGLVVRDNQAWYRSGMKQQPAVVIGKTQQEFAKYLLAGFVSFASNPSLFNVLIFLDLIESPYRFLR